MSYINDALTANENVIARAKVTGYIYLNPFNLIIFAFIKRWTTEMAVTNERIIHKVGLISRTAHEMPLWKIESININQGILGRIFGFGDVVVTGTGNQFLHFKSISSPLRFKKTISDAADAYQRSR
ncbi:MAG: PH domain-containing protein [Desulfovibrio sp.]|jgi:uncharacterized membrane protein YdbT with pleckstrin-like domain|nr:PH domain-containing protein [Desulfovibrio sp.]